jgi:anthranilate 1,2-dioxygenase small subunit
MVDETVKRQVEQLHSRYIRAIDDDKLEDWPGLFTEQCVYKIMTRENYDQGLPLAVMDCRSRGMLQDRVTGLRKINVFEPHTYKHQISGLFVKASLGHTVECWSNYMVVRTMADGAMSIFSAGIYLDKILLEPGGAKFQERIVVADSRRIETLLVIPL